MIKTMINGNMTIKDALKSAIMKLSQNQSIDTPHLDAEVLLCCVLGCERIKLSIDKDMVLDEDSILLFNKYVNRRAKNEPISYITKIKEFMSLEFFVSEGVLIPRPDTEILVEEIINIFNGKSAKILDLCTGSGAIAISVANYLKDAYVTAVDKFDICIETTLKNIKKHNLSDRVNVLYADVLGDFVVAGDFDCIVSNPPYIKKEVLTSLPSDVRDYEPIYALDGGNDGLVFYRKITDFSSEKLNSGGILTYEIGFDQAEDVKSIIAKTDCFKNIRVLKDLAGLDRVVIAEKR